MSLLFEDVNDNVLQSLQVTEMTPFVMDARDRPTCSIYEVFTPEEPASIHNPFSLKDLSWLVYGAVLRENKPTTVVQGAVHFFSKDIPTWAAYNYVIGS